MCGADQFGFGSHLVSAGSSPRVRSRRPVRRKTEAPYGIISACAEQTRCIQELFPERGDHLRVCGADSTSSISWSAQSGSSPRVRSRLAKDGGEALGRRIISACAEQTANRSARTRATRDHLRVCGADSRPDSSADSCAGSSPRVRSRRCGLSCLGWWCGIISACAEQTRGARARARLWGDHLRVCGADQRHGRTTEPDRGSSPRVRSRRSYTDMAHFRSGIISACAEQTSRRSCGRRRPWDHLRVCGAD